MNGDKAHYVGLTTIALLGLLPLVLRAIGLLPSTPVSIVILLANLAVCLWAFRNGKFGWFWVVYSACCLATLGLAGTTSPIALAVTLLTLPML